MSKSIPFGVYRKLESAKKYIKTIYLKYFYNSK